VPRRELKAAAFHGSASGSSPSISAATWQSVAPNERVEYLFKQASLLHDPHGAGWTLHQLRHSALGHLAASGRTGPELQAKSRHKHLTTLGHYVRLGEETSARITAENDPLNRRRTTTGADQVSPKEAMGWSATR
jgi:integrase